MVHTGGAEQPTHDEPTRMNCFLQVHSHPLVMMALGGVLRHLTQALLDLKKPSLQVMSHGYGLAKFSTLGFIHPNPFSTTSAGQSAHAASDTGPQVLMSRYCVSVHLVLSNAHGMQPPVVGEM